MKLVPRFLKVIETSKFIMGSESLKEGPQEGTVWGCEVEVTKKTSCGKGKNHRISTQQSLQQGAELANKEAMRGAGNKAGPLDHRWFCHEFQMLDMNLYDLVFALLGFGLAFVWSFLSIVPFFHLGMGTVIPSHRMVKTFKLLFDYTGVQS